MVGKLGGGPMHEKGAALEAKVKRSACFALSHFARRQSSEAMPDCTGCNTVTRFQFAGASQHDRRGRRAHTGAALVVAWLQETRPAHTGKEGNSPFGRRVAQRTAAMALKQMAERLLIESRATKWGEPQVGVQVGGAGCPRKSRGGRANRTRQGPR
jgi:hypothetical protein